MSGSPCIAGTRIRVMDLVRAYQAGAPVEELQEYFSSRALTLSEIHAALAYYWDHHEELDADIERRTRFVEQMRTDTRAARLW